MLNNEQVTEVLDRIKQRIYADNIAGTLEQTLIAWNIPYTFEIKESANFNNSQLCNPKGKIVIIGGAEMKRNKFEGMLKDKYGLSNGDIQKRFELVLEYEGLNHYNFNKLSKYEYSVIIMGPAPHSVKGKGNYSSLITMLESNEDDYYPPVFRLSQNEPITKSQVENALSRLLMDGIIEL